MMLYLVIDVVERHCNPQVPQIEDCTGEQAESYLSF